MPTGSWPAESGRRLLARRTALTGALALAAAACTASPPGAEVRSPSATESGSPTPSPSPAPGSPADEADEEAHDVALAATAAAAAVRAADLVRRTRTRHRSLRGPLQPLQAAHEGHARFLAGALERAQVPARRGQAIRVADEPERALAQVRAATEDLRVRLADLAVRSRSGRFARALASMSASMAQHLGTLPASPQRRPSAGARSGTGPGSTGPGGTGPGGTGVGGTGAGGTG